MSETYPKISFGIIVLNGEPFTRYCLRALYPFAHEIIVAEGASPKAAAIATKEGHSRDGTLEVLYDFKNNEDPEDKLIIVTAEDEGYPDGFWPGEKDEQSRAYAKRVTGDYLWQVDIDEFYQLQDIKRIIELLQEDPNISEISFKQITFWGGLDYSTDGYYLHLGPEIIPRLFRWGNGYEYVTHRPPTVIDEHGQDLRTLKMIQGQDLADKGIYLYHYSLLFPKQVMEKCEYYTHQNWEHSTAACEWAEKNYFLFRNPFRVHNVYNYPSWLIRFQKDHPPAIQQMWNDILDKKVEINLRDNSDVEKIIDTPYYRGGITILKSIEPFYRFYHSIIKVLCTCKKKVKSVQIH